MTYICTAIGAIMSLAQSYVELLLFYPPRQLVFLPQRRRIP